MNKFFFSICAALIALSSCSQREILEMIVGTYTYDGGAGIYTLDFYPDDASWTLRDSIASANASYIVRSEDGKFIYAVNESDVPVASVVAFSKEGSKLSPIGSQPTNGGYPCYIDTDGQFLTVANYIGGTLCVYPLSEGRVQPMIQEIHGTTGGPDLTRQELPHVHCSIFSPDNKYLIATDFSADKIMAFSVTSDSLVYKDSYSVEPETGPRHVTFSPDGNLACVIGELSGKITLMRYKEGAFDILDTAVCDTLSARGSADVRFSPDGRFIYASNRLAGDGIAIFKVDADSGTLEKVAYQLTAGHPRNFSLSPDGNYLFCASRDGDCVEIYRRNTVSGLITLVGSIPFIHPVYVQTFAD